MRSFVLGVGAQKAGTTWLFEQLKKQSNFTKGFAKEYHFFDSLYLPECAPFRRNTERQAIKSIEGGISHYKNKASVLKMGFYVRPEMYFEYFNSILNDGSFTADITPSYSGLDREVFEKIRVNFESRNIKVKVVFIMREPVTRIESAIRMNLRKSDRLSKLSPTDVWSILEKEVVKKEAILRSNYEKTAAELRAGFHHEDIYFGFYETMFLPEEIERLGQFLDIDASLMDAGKMVNSSPKNYRYDARKVKQMQAFYKDQYDFVQSSFGLDIRLWEAAALNISS